MTNDIKVLKKGLGTEVFGAEDRTASSVVATMKPGEPVKRAGTGGNFVYPLADGDPENGTDIFVGIVHKESNETSALDGEVTVEVCGQGTTLEGKASTPANINTAAKLLAVRHDYVSFDVTASSGTNGIFTIDEDEGDDPNVHGLFIIGGDITKGTLRVFNALSLFYGNGI